MQIKKLARTLIDRGKSMDLQPDLVDKYLWEVGNRFCNKSDFLNCPLYNDCQKKC